MKTFVISIWKQPYKYIAAKWRGIPLKGAAQNELIQDFQEAGITDATRHPIDTFKKCCSQFTHCNIELKDRQATKQDLQNWPRYLTKPREKFKIII